MERKPVSYPPTRSDMVMAYDADRGSVVSGMTYDTRRKRIVLFGGFDGSVLLSDTWEYAGTNWVRRAPATIDANPHAARTAIDA